MQRTTHLGVYHHDFFPKALAAGFSLQWFALFYTSLCHVHRFRPRASNTLFFSSSGAFDAPKTLYIPCFLFFSCWAIEAHHHYRTSQVFVAAIPLPFRPFPLRFNSRATHFHYGFTPASVTVAALLASLRHRPGHS